MSSHEDVDQQIEMFRQAHSWEATAALISAQAMYMIARAVIDGKVSSREAARRMGVTRTSMARFVDKVKEGKWVAKTNEALDETAYSHIIWAVTGKSDVPAPFVVEEGEDGKRRVSWA